MAVITQVDVVTLDGQVTNTYDIGADANNVTVYDNGVYKSLQSYISQSGGSGSSASAGINCIKPLSLTRSSAGVYRVNLELSSDDIGLYVFYCNANTADGTGSKIRSSRSGNTTEYLVYASNQTGRYATLKSNTYYVMLFTGTAFLQVASMPTSLS